MNILPINNNNNQTFGHSFRVSICLNNGIQDVFVNPYKDKELYRLLNSKIVNALNEDFYTNLRKVYGIQRKNKKSVQLNEKFKEMIAELKGFDDDYANLGIVKSVYLKNKLAYIATGSDVPIIENLKGAKHLGIAKADSKWFYGTLNTDYIRDLGKAIKQNIINFVESDNLLLRSKNDKEIMLRTVFKINGKDSRGLPNYELNSFEFHENVSKPTLKPVSQEYITFKKSQRMQEEIRHTIKHILDKMLGKKSRFESV